MNIQLKQGINMKAGLKFLFFAFLTSLFSCNEIPVPSPSEDYAVILVEKKELSNFTISVGDTLKLNLTTYFECRKKESNRFEQYPDIVPSVSDTNVAGICYDYLSDKKGKGFSVTGIKADSTTVILTLSWLNDYFTETAEREFKLMVE